jgi:hypothetical protein
MVVMAASEADAESDNRPWWRIYNHRSRTRTNWRGVNDDRREMHVNRRWRRIPGWGLISVNGCRRNRAGNGSAGNHTRQNFSRSGPLAVAGRGMRHAARKKGTRRQSHNQRSHKIPFVIPAYVHS